MVLKHFDDDDDDDDVMPHSKVKEESGSGKRATGSGTA